MTTGGDAAFGARTRELLHHSELTSLPRICGLAAGSRQERTGRWWLLDAAVEEVPAFNVATGTGPPLLAGDLAAARRWFGDLPHRLLARREEDAALIEEALREGYAVDEVDGACVLAGPPDRSPEAAGARGRRGDLAGAPRGVRPHRLGGRRPGMGRNRHRATGAGPRLRAAARALRGRALRQLSRRRRP